MLGCTNKHQCTLNSFVVLAQEQDMTSNNDGVYMMSKLVICGENVTGSFKTFRRFQFKAVRVSSGITVLTEKIRGYCGVVVRISRENTKILIRHLPYPPEIRQFCINMLRSTMFAGYNQCNDAKVRIGSWREELAMKELTGVTRATNPKNKAVYNSTGIR